MNNYINGFMWDAIIHPQINFNGHNYGMDV